MMTSEDVELFADQLPETSHELLKQLKDAIEGEFQRQLMALETLRLAQQREIDARRAQVEESAGSVKRASARRGRKPMQPRVNGGNGSSPYRHSV